MIAPAPGSRIWPGQSRTVWGRGAAPRLPCQTPDLSSVTTVRGPAAPLGYHSAGSAWFDCSATPSRSSSKGPPGWTSSVIAALACPADAGLDIGTALPWRARQTPALTLAQRRSSTARRAAAATSCYLTRGPQPGSPRRLRRRMTAMSMTATAAIASRTTTKPIGALIKYAQIAKAVQMTKPNTASHSRNVRALMAGAAPPIPDVGS
jgi:hypothetical protein